MRNLILAIAAVGAMTATAAAQDTATATWIGTDGAEIGTASLRQTPNGVLITVEVRGIPAGEHGFHIHTTGQCDAAGGFQSAGGHLSGDKQHGFLVEGGPHPGDMANVFVGSDGLFKVEVVNARVSIRGGAQTDAAINEGGAVTPLLDADGAALMIHSGADDYQSQPAGDAGSRIACAVIH